MDVNFTVPDVFKYEFGLTKTKVDLAWHPTLRDSSIRNLVDLTTPPYTNTPNFIVIGNPNLDLDYFYIIDNLIVPGMNLHYIAHEFDAARYENDLKRMEPYLRKLSLISKVNNKQDQTNRYPLNEYLLLNSKR